MGPFVIHTECQNSEATMFAILILQFSRRGEAALDGEESALAPTVLAWMGAPSVEGESTEREKKKRKESRDPREIR
jgi:hypothetical protein